VSSPDESEVHRFVVAFRREPRELPGAPSLWRGWIMRIDSQVPARPDESPHRIWFSQLEELPGAIRRLIAEARGIPGLERDPGS
jgi:hypothetical protein